ncbi:hypothetical protein GQN04_24085, partial [Escherichia coli]|nr:hypothetical protein [Escherichia coli]
GHIEINRVEYLQLQEEFARRDAANSSQNNDAKDDHTIDFAALRKQAEGLILQLAKGGYRAEAIAILEKQGARKLGEVTDENLAEVITLAEKALEGYHARRSCTTFSIISASMDALPRKSGAGGHTTG